MNVSKLPPKLETNTQISIPQGPAPTWSPAEVNMINTISDETERLNQIGRKNADILLGKSMTNIVDNCNKADQPGKLPTHGK